MNVMINVVVFIALSCCASSAAVTTLNYHGVLDRADANYSHPGTDLFNTGVNWEAEIVVNLDASPIAVYKGSGYSDYTMTPFALSMSLFVGAEEGGMNISSGSVEGVIRAHNDVYGNDRLSLIFVYLRAFGDPNGFQREGNVVLENAMTLIEFSLTDSSGNWFGDDTELPTFIDSASFDDASFLYSWISLHGEYEDAYIEDRSGVTVYVTEIPEPSSTFFLIVSGMLAVHNRRRHQ